MQLKETLRSISSHSSYDDESLPAYLVSDKPIIHIKKSVLTAADVPENSFDKAVLKSRFESYSQELGNEGEVLIAGSTQMNLSVMDYWGA